MQFCLSLSATGGSTGGSVGFSVVVVGTSGTGVGSSFVSLFGAVENRNEFKKNALV